MAKQKYIILDTYQNVVEMVEGTLAHAREQAEANAKSEETPMALYQLMGEVAVTTEPKTTWVPA